MFGIEDVPVVYGDTNSDSVALYKKFCEDEHCKPNSAFIRYLQDRGNSLQLEKLSFSFNYLGPKGLIPIIRMVDRCQTLITLDLENNGADNNTVEVLCDVLQHHLGITWLSLRGNPITQQGGKRLLQLVQSNPRITYIDVSATDIYEAVQQAIYVTVERHRKSKEESGDLQPADLATRQVAKEVLSNLPPLQKRKEPVSIRPVALAKPAAGKLAGAEGGGTAAPKKPTKKGSATKTSASLFLDALGETEESDDSDRGMVKRLPAEQLRKLREKFAERARLAHELQRSEVNRTANRVRAELMTLERNGTDVTLPPLGAHLTRRDPSEGFAQGEHREPLPEAQEDLKEKEEQNTEDDDEETRRPAPAAGLVGVRTQKTQPPAPPPVEGADDDDLRPDIKDALHPAQRLYLSSEEQFQSLFDQGCREYQHHQLDQAYIAWNEAMGIAVAHKNREWIAVLTTNMQHLTYEIFMQDGKTKLENGQLEEADRCFERAMRIATKAKNAQWQSEMIRARQSVKCAVFYKCHKAALLLLNDAKALNDREVTEGDYYILPQAKAATEGEDGVREDTEALEGSQSKVGNKIQHSKAFVNEWPRIRLVWEAVGMWVDAAKVAKKVGTAAQGALLDVLHEALNNVSVFLIQLHFEHTEPHQSVSWQGCSQYTYHECIKLSELYVDLIGFHQQHLHHELLSCVVDLQLGNLALAIYELPQAHQRFSSALRSARKMGVGILEATALTFGATVNIQRANYAVAERELLEARLYWENSILPNETAATQPLVPSPPARRLLQSQENTPDAYASSPSSNEANTTGTADPVELDDTEATTTSSTASVLRKVVVRTPLQAVTRAIPQGYTTVMANAGNALLVMILASTYRYQDALEMLEYGLLHRYHDLLFEKMRVNFAEHPSLGQLAGVAGVLRSHLVYYFLSHRFSWSVDREVYEMEESVLMWVVPRVGDMRFVELNVSKEHKTTVGALIHQARAGMLVDPPVSGTSDAMVLATHRRAWIEPLEQLHAILLDPIASYMRSLELPFDPQHSVITVVPTGALWTVPFNALINRHGRFAVEDFGIQLAFCATQAHFSTVSTERVRERNLQRSVIVRQVEMPALEGEDRGLPASPCDCLRSCAEADALLHTIRDERVARLSAAIEANTPAGGALLTPSEELVDDLPTARRAMPGARTLHLGVATSYGRGVHPEDSSIGEVHIPMYRTEEHPAYMDVLHAAEVSHMELFAEVVSMSCTSIGVDERGVLVEDVLGLSRAFLSSGTPCVVVGQWCTPDIYPVAVFSRFYQLLCHHAASSVQHAASRSNAPHAFSVSNSTHTEALYSMGGEDGQRHTGHAHANGPEGRWHYSTGVAGTRATGASVGGMGSSNNVKARIPAAAAAAPSQASDVLRHKAHYMAEAQRELLKDPSMRYCPRAWAGYYCVGSGFF